MGSTTEDMGLSDREIEMINRTLNGKGEVEHGGIVQVYFAQFDDRSRRLQEWAYANIEGGLCLVYEYDTGQYYFMVYDLVKFKRLYEFEIYEEMEYLEHKAGFHVYKTSTGMVGFRFASEFNAKAFYAYFNEKDVPQYVQFLNSDGTLNLEKIPKSWKNLFKDAGYTMRELMDPSMTESLLNWVYEVGEYQDKRKVYKMKKKRGINKKPPPPPPPPRRSTLSSGSGASSMRPSGAYR